ncbi:CaiB/BaiF CoA-transferase family protein [Brevibacterium sp. BRM-1]|uniref:CaiB/BaiF CoA transferase family protein n=1 Tax=Brevibacterium sp. BRM-1 TaxID=2999062 RepID=UPI002280FCC4|nr:CaiB/BaiF CoA-transferase family protein [Brevibacterium sp. BRM-1]WAL39780.1 CaiB/BaiF CoA-transferase family protein [Brevibacterium sp. BRM-1]
MTTDPPTDHLPLQGITVVSCEQAVAAPFATRQLADLGARVIKIERPGSGDFARGYDTSVRGLSSHFVWINRSKESFSADLKEPADREIVLEMIRSADVFVQNFAPGAAERLGFGPDELRAHNDRLIYTSISGFGDSGPYRDAKAYDALIQAEAGLVSITGTEDSPAKTGISTADIAAGMYAFSGILTALYDRERTGRGQTLRVSLFDSLVEWMGYPLYFSRYGGRRPSRAGTSHAAIAPYGTFGAGDGIEFVISVQNEREWERFCTTVLKRPDLTADPRFASASVRSVRRAELETEIDHVFQTLTGAELAERLAAAKIAHARQRDIADVSDHPQLIERDRWVAVDSPAGSIEMTKPAVVFSGSGFRMDPIPALGEHTDALREEFAPGGNA